jgi:hypothetical protein
VAAISAVFDPTLSAPTNPTEKVYVVPLDAVRAGVCLSEV